MEVDCKQAGVPLEKPAKAPPWILDAFLAILSSSQLANFKLESSKQLS